MEKIAGKKIIFKSIILLIIIILFIIINLNEKNDIKISSTDMLNKDYNKAEKKEEKINYIEVTLNKEVLQQLGYTVKYQGHWFGPKISLYEFKKNGEYVTDFDIPATYEHNGKKYKITKIGDYVFYSNSLLMSVTIPNTVTEIGDHAFYLNESLINITIPDSVTKIGNYAFAYCSFKNMIIPKTVTQIGENAFYCVSHIEYYGSAKDPKSFLFFNGKWGAKAMN